MFIFVEGFCGIILQDCFVGLFGMLVKLLEKKKELNSITCLFILFVNFIFM